MFELIPYDHRMRRCSPFDPFAAMDPFFAPDRSFMRGAFSTDIVDKGESFEIDAELPGFAKEDIKLDVADDRLTITAERKSEENDEKPNYVKRERFYGSFTRSFDLTGIDVEKIEASYKDGILSLNLPKLPEEVPVSRQIEIR